MRLRTTKDFHGLHARSKMVSFFKAGCQCSCICSMFSFIGYVRIDACCMHRSRSSVLFAADWFAWAPLRIQAVTLTYMYSNTYITMFSKKFKILQMHIKYTYIHILHAINRMRSSCGKVLSEVYVLRCEQTKSLCNVQSEARGERVS